MIKRLEIRTQRYYEDQDKNITYEEKARIEDKMRKIEAENMLLKDEQDILIRKV